MGIGSEALYRGKKLVVGRRIIKMDMTKDVIIGNNMVSGVNVGVSMEGSMENPITGGRKIKDLKRAGYWKWSLMRDPWTSIISDTWASITIAN